MGEDSLRTILFPDLEVALGFHPDHAEHACGVHSSLANLCPGSRYDNDTGVGDDGIVRRVFSHLSSLTEVPM